MQKLQKKVLFLILPITMTPIVVGGIFLYYKTEFTSFEVYMMFVLGLFVAFVSAFLAIGVFFFLLNKIFIEPIRLLNLAIKQVEQGNFNIEFESKSADELGDLLISFKQMAHRMGDVNRFLEREVEKRTLEIGHKNQQLETTVEENKGLVRVLCHDLNNALSIIDTTSKMAFKLIDPQDKTFRLWERVYRACEMQREIMEHVRDMESINSGKMQLKSEPVRIKDIVENALFIFREKFEDKKIKFIFEDSDLSDIYIQAEKVTVCNHVFNNLISNAIKFSNLNETIVFKVQPKGDRVVVSITDRGIGIPEDILKNLFNPSKKTSRLGTLGEKGTGFGMPLVKSYLTYFGADIVVESREVGKHPEDHGTTMKLTFKRAYDKN